MCAHPGVGRKQGGGQPGRPAGPPPAGRPLDLRLTRVCCCGPPVGILLPAENISYIIPTPVIEHFINDYERHGRYTGFPSLGEPPLLLLLASFSAVFPSRERHGRYTGFPSLGRFEPAWSVCCLLCLRERLRAARVLDSQHPLLNAHCSILNPLLRRRGVAEDGEPGAAPGAGHAGKD